MIVVTLVAVILGIPVEYLRRWATIHEHEAAVIEGRVRRRSMAFDFLIWDGQDSRMHEYHERVAKEYRAAVCRPWNFVNEKTPAPNPPKP